MSVLTYKEFKNTLVGEKISPQPKVEIQEIKKEVKEKFEYILLHPENGVYDKQNFEDVININKKDYKRICKNGVVRTIEKELATFLIAKGYELMEKISVV